jgi:hypothetical protein
LTSSLEVLHAPLQTHSVTDFKTENSQTIQSTVYNVLNRN